MYILKRALPGMLLAVLLSTASAFAQYSVSGKITDANSDEPLIGANVLIKGTVKGTTTDIEGRYQLDFEQKQVTLVVSYVGYQSLEKPIEGKDDFTQNFQLSQAPSLEEVVIQGIRADERAPVSQTTVKKQEIEEVYVGQDALYVLEKVTPSILTYSESGTNITNYGQMRLRGIDQTRINITLNGVPLNDMIDQGVFFSNFTDFGNSIESVQVQRGVGTSTNGTASYAGSINFESVNLKDSAPSANVQLLAGSYDTFRGSAEVKSGLMDNKFAFYTRFSSIKSNGYRHHTGTDSYSFFFSGGYFGEKDLVKLTAFTGRTKNDLAYLPTALPDIEADPRTNYVSENDIDDFGQSLVQLEYTRWLGNNTSLASTVYYGSAGGDFPAGFPDENGDFMQINYPLYNDHYGFMTNLSHTSLDGRLEVTGGAHLYTFRRENIEQVVPNYTDPYYDDKSQKDEVSVFGKASYTLEQLTLYADVQLRAVSLALTPDQDFLGQAATIPNREWTFVNPKAGLTYALNNDYNVYASFGRSGREPTRFDILGSTQINASNLESVQDVDAVKPEYVNDFEAGFRINRNKLNGQVNVFYMQFENEIAPIGEAIPEAFVQLRKNVPESYRRGVELDFNYQIIPALRFGGNATYMQSRIKEYAPEDADQVYTNVHPIISPEWMVNGEVEYNFNDIVKVALNPRYVSESFLEPTNQSDLILPAYFVMDSRISWNFWKDHSFSLHLNNIFNEEYYSFGQPVAYGEETVPGYFVQAPFNMYVMLNLRF